MGPGSSRSGLAFATTAAHAEPCHNPKHNLANEFPSSSSWQSISFSRAHARAAMAGILNSRCIVGPVASWSCHALRHVSACSALFALRFLGTRGCSPVPSLSLPSPHSSHTCTYSLLFPCLLFHDLDITWANRLGSAMAARVTSGIIWSGRNA